MQWKTTDITNIPDGVEAMSGSQEAKMGDGLRVGDVPAVGFLKPKVLRPGSWRNGPQRETER